MKKAIYHALFDLGALALGLIFIIEIRWHYVLKTEFKIFTIIGIMLIIVGAFGILIDGIREAIKRRNEDK